MGVGRMIMACWANTVLCKLLIWKKVRLYECGPFPPPHGPNHLKGLHFCALNIYTMVGSWCYQFLWQVCNHLHFFVCTETFLHPPFFQHHSSIRYFMNFNPIKSKLCLVKPHWSMGYCSVKVETVIEVLYLPICCASGQTHFRCTWVNTEWILLWKHFHGL